MHFLNRVTFTNSSNNESWQTIAKHDIHLVSNSNKSHQLWQSKPPTFIDAGFKKTKETSDTTHWKQMHDAFIHLYHAFRERIEIWVELNDNNFESCFTVSCTNIWKQKTKVHILWLFVKTRNERRKSFFKSNRLNLQLSPFSLFLIPTYISKLLGSVWTEHFKSFWFWVNILIDKFSFEI